MSQQRDIIDMLQKLVNVINVNIEENESVELNRKQPHSKNHYQIPKQSKSPRKVSPKLKAAKKSKSPKKKRTYSPELYSKDPYIYAKTERKDTKPKLKRRPSSPRKLYLRKTTKMVDVGIQTSKALLMDDSEFLQQILYFTPNNRFSQASRALKRRYFNVWQKKWSVKISEHYRDIIRQNMLGRRGGDSSSSRKSNDSLMKDDSTQNVSPKAEKSPTTIEKQPLPVLVKRKPLYPSSESETVSFESSDVDDEISQPQSPPSKPITKQTPPIVPKLCIPISIIGGEPEINYDQIDKYDSGNDNYVPPNAPRQSHHMQSPKDEEFAELASQNEEVDPLDLKESPASSTDNSVFDEMESNSSKEDVDEKSDHFTQNIIQEQHDSSEEKDDSLLDFLKEENKRLEEESEEEKQNIILNSSPSSHSDIMVNEEEEPIETAIQELPNKDSTSSDDLLFEDNEEIVEEIVEENKENNEFIDKSQEIKEESDNENDFEEKIEKEAEDIIKDEIKSEEDDKLSTSSESLDIPVESENDEVIEEENTQETQKENNLDFVFSSSSDDEIDENEEKEDLKHEEEEKKEENIESESFDINSSEFDEKNVVVSEPEPEPEPETIKEESASFDINSSELDNSSFEDSAPVQTQPTLIVTPEPEVSNSFDGTTVSNSIVQSIASEEIKLVCDMALELKPVKPTQSAEEKEAVVDEMESSGSIDDFDIDVKAEEKISVSSSYSNDDIQFGSNEFNDDDDEDDEANFRFNVNDSDGEFNSDSELESEEEKPSKPNRTVDSAPVPVFGEANNGTEEIIEDNSNEYAIVEEEGDNQEKDEEIVISEEELIIETHSGETPQYIDGNSDGLVVDAPDSDKQDSDSSDPFDVDDLDLEISDEDLVVKSKPQSNPEPQSKPKPQPKPETQPENKSSSSDDGWGEDIEFSFSD